MVKSELIRFRCTTEQRKSIESAAAAQNMSLTDYIIQKLDCSHKNKVVATKQRNKPVIVATNETKVKNVATKKEETKKEIDTKGKTIAQILAEKRA